MKENIAAIILSSASLIVMLWLYIKVLWWRIKSRFGTRWGFVLLTLGVVFDAVLLVILIVYASKLLGIGEIWGVLNI